MFIEKGFITRNNNNSRSLNYSSPLFGALTVERLNKTTFSPPTARIMVTDSLKNLDNEWSFGRNNSIVLFSFYKYGIFLSQVLEIQKKIFEKNHNLQFLINF